jgi:hypothetical protein
LGEAASYRLQAASLGNPRQAKFESLRQKRREPAGTTRDEQEQALSFKLTAFSLKEGL